MRHFYCIIVLFFTFTTGNAQALASDGQNFADYFQDKTLRVDYIFTGNANQQSIYLDELSQLPTWAGRQHNLS